MNLAISLRSEVLKTKRTASFYFTLIGAAVVPFVFLLNVLMDGLEDVKNDPLNKLFKLLAEMNGLAFFPWFIILICTLLPHVEFRNNTWKQVFTSPQSKGMTFLAKFLTIHFLLLVFLVATHLFMFLAIFTANFLDPELRLLQYPFNGYTVLVNAVNSYTTMLAVCSIQFWMGLRFKNFIVPIAVGLALWLTGLLLALEFHSSLANYFPYSFQVFHTIDSYKPALEQVVWTSLGYAAVFLFFGYLDFKTRRLNT